MTTLGVVAALAAEARALGRATRRTGASASFGNLKFLSDGSIVAVSGIGYAAAEQAASTLIDAGVSCLMTFGLSGGLDPALTAGNIVIPDEIVSQDGTRIATHAVWCRELRRALAGRSAGGALLTSLAPIDSVAAKARAFQESAAVAVDMESMAVARLAAAQSMPFVSIRAIIDTSTDVLPQAVVAASRLGRVQVSRLVLGLLRSPQDIVGLMRLSTRYRAAMRALTGVARSGSLAFPAGSAPA